MITVIGLGNEKGDLTKRGEEEILKAVKEGRKIAVRTANTLSYQTVRELNVPHVCLDEVYNKSRSFATLSKNLAKAVLSLGKDAVVKLMPMPTITASSFPSPVKIASTSIPTHFFPSKYISLSHLI